MQRGCLLFVTWCYRNKRKKLMIATFLCAVCVLVWQIPRNEEDVQYEAILFQAHRQPGKVVGVPDEHILNDTMGFRQRNMVQECVKKFGTSWSRFPAKLPKFSESPIISTKHNLLYCPVGKVASSFLTRVVLAMDKPGPMTSPFTIPIEQAGRGRCQSFASIGSKANVSHFLQKSIKVVFGRDPFSRIFSAFIDKLFSPNPFYWSYWGEKALKLHKVKTIRKACASEITFQQFLHLVLYDLHKNDVHLRQVYDECRMCDVIYDIAGKLETTVEDLDYLLAKLNVSSSFQHEESYSVDSKMDIIYDSVKSTFSWKKDISRCISLDQMGLRIWRKLQIRGVIDSSISYPFSPGDIDNMSASKFIEACKSALLKSTDKNQLKKQKSQAFLEAYKSVSEKDLLAVGRVYKDDFAMFGYNPKPASIFDNRDKIIFTGSLNWRADWIL